MSENDNFASLTSSPAEHPQPVLTDVGNDDTTAALNRIPCGCAAIVEPHLENFATWQEQVREGLKNLKNNDVQYDRIELFMVYWIGGDVPEVAENAIELGTLLGGDPYNFSVTPHAIDYQNSEQYQIDDDFDEALTNLRVRLRSNNKDVSNLLILYYGGHGVEHNADRLWRPSRQSTKGINWSNYQSRMYNITCDILYLFDCCRSMAMVETNSTTSQHRQRCEIFCSSGLKESSAALNKANFTRALKELLAKKKEAREPIAGMTFESICARMTEKRIRDKLTAEPRWKVVLSNPAFRGRITIALKGNEPNPPHSQPDDSDSGYDSVVESRSKQSNTRVLIKIRLRNPAEDLSANDWLKWFEQRPHNVARIDVAVVSKIEWVGVFESDSSLVLITIPLWLWQNIKQDPACESLGIVRSENLLQKPSLLSRLGNLQSSKISGSEDFTSKSSQRMEVSSTNKKDKSKENTTKLRLSFRFPSSIMFDHDQNTEFKTKPSPISTQKRDSKSPENRFKPTKNSASFQWPHLSQPQKILPDTEVVTAVAKRLRYVRDL